MDQADAAAIVGADLGLLAAAPGQPPVRLVVRLAMDIPVTLALDENGSIKTVGLGRPSFVQDCDDDSEKDSDDENDEEEDSDDDDDDEEDSDDNDAQMDTDDGYETDNSVVFLGEVIRLD